MDATPRWSLPLLFAGQAQKEIFHNEALMLVDALLHGRVESADLGAPPTDPAVGQCWIVAAPAEDAWGGEVGSIACWTEGGWRFVAPRAGLRMAVGAKGRDVLMQFLMTGANGAPARSATTGFTRLMKKWWARASPLLPVRRGAA